MELHIEYINAKLTVPDTDHNIVVLTNSLLFCFYPSMTKGVHLYFSSILYFKAG